LSYFRGNLLENPNKFKFGLVILKSRLATCSTYSCPPDLKVNLAMLPRIVLGTFSFGSTFFKAMRRIIVTNNFLFFLIYSVTNYKKVGGLLNFFSSTSNPFMILGLCKAVLANFCYSINF